MRSVKPTNLEPPYISALEAVSEETASTLVSLVDERGKRSEWAYNPDCTELQIANPFSRFSVKNDEKIISILPDLFGLSESCMRHMNRYFQNNVCDIITGHHGFWVLKYEAGGQFSLHCDWDSGPNGIRPPIVATACVLLNDDFKGGETLLLTSNAEQTIVPREKLSILMWDGFTQHKIATVTEGTRYALIIHYTGTIK